MSNKNWTIVIQISGENNLLLESIAAFDELAETGSSDKINFVVLMDSMQVIGELPERYKEYEYLKNENQAKPSVYLMKKDEFYSNANPVKTFEIDDLHAKNNRENIYQFIKDKFPADNFGFIYKGHGQRAGTDVENNIFITKIFKVKPDEYTAEGKLKTKIINERIAVQTNDEFEEYVFSEFFCLDDEERFPKIVLGIFYKENENSAFLTYADLQQSLHTVFGHRGLSFVLLDCCWGMILENIHQFKDTTMYLVASPDEMPALGIGYGLFSKLIVKKPGIKPNELAKLLVSVFYTQRFDDYNDPTDKTFLHMGVSLTCVNTDTYNKKILSRLKKLLNYLITDMPGLAKQIMISINHCKDYTYSNPNEYKIYNLDLVWFLENLIYENKNDEELMLHCFNLLADIQLYLIKGVVSNNYDETVLGERFIGGKGISITLPKTRSYFNLSNIGKNDSGLEFYNDTSWKIFLTTYYEYFEKIKLLYNTLKANEIAEVNINFLIDSDLKSGNAAENLKYLTGEISKIKSNKMLTGLDNEDFDAFSKISIDVKEENLQYIFEAVKAKTNIVVDNELFVNTLNENIESKWKKLETVNE